MIRPLARSHEAVRAGKLATVLCFGLVGLACLGIAFAAVLWLTDPGSTAGGRRPTRTLAQNRPTQPDPRKAAEPWVPRFTDDWTDDSGYGLAVRETLPIRDPQSLAEVRSSVEGRAERGIARLHQELDRLDPTIPVERALMVQKMAFIGALSMYEGKFDEASAWLDRAQKIDPESPRLILANLEAFRGVAALRRGESDNCVACSTAASCIFPLAESARHRFPSGSEEAIQHFTAYLKERPDDLGIQWLLNIAHMTLGTFPSGVPERFRISLDPVHQQGDIGAFPNIAMETGLASRGENMAGGQIVDDFNGDGLLDIFYSTIDASMDCALFVNTGDGRFENHSSKAGLELQAGAENCVGADFDNDGDLDVLLLRGAWETPRRLSLLRNDGHGAFTDVTMAAGLDRPMSSETAAWADFDRDGDLDLYVGGEFQPSGPEPLNRGRLYQNNGDGTFTDIAEHAGVPNERFCRGVAWGDYDNDGWIDLYLSNQGQKNRLYHNNQDGTFTDLAETLNVADPVGSYGCWFWDYDNDGWLDLFVTGSAAMMSDVIRSHLGQHTTGERPRLYHNDRGKFNEVGIPAGLDRVWLPMGLNFGDLDNDGFLDFYLGTGNPPYSFLMPNVLMHNRDGKRFEDITTSSGTGHLQKGHGIAFADWDEDGDLDLFLETGGAVPGDKAHNALFQNPGHGNAWLKLRLIGTHSNRDAIGARVCVRVDGRDGKREIRRQVGPGASFGCNPLRMTIGLGRADSIEAIEIDWPVGTHQVVENARPYQSIAVTEGSAEMEIAAGVPAP